MGGNDDEDGARGDGHPKKHMKIKKKKSKKKKKTKKNKMKKVERR